MTHPLFKISKAGGASVLYCISLIVSGCTVGPDFVRPQSPTIDHYNHKLDPSETVPVEGKTQHFSQGIGPVANWWNLFQSKQLDAAVTEGINNNPSLEAAQANLRASYDILQAGYGIYYPQVNVGAGASRQRSSPASIGSAAPSSIFNLTTISASVSYPLDIFGGERRAVENLESQAEIQRATVLVTYLALSGNIVNTFIATAAYQEEIQNTEQVIALQKEQITLAEKQNQAGTTSFDTVLSLRSQLASFEANLPPLGQKLDQATHLLATLEGHIPSDWLPSIVPMSEITLPSDLPLSLPSDLVHQRPDILAAEAQMHAASANIGIATAAQFPSFTLNGTFGQGSTSLNGLLGQNSNFWSAGASITAPIFNGGALSAKKKAAVDTYQQSQGIYRQTVLNAFAQVADTLKALEHDAETVQAQNKSVETAKESLHLAQINYQSGMINYLQVISADIQYHQASINYLQAQAQRLQDTTALFTALGGGWWHTDNYLSTGKH